MKKSALAVFVQATTTVLTNALLPLHSNTHPSQQGPRQPSKLEIPLSALGLTSETRKSFADPKAQPSPKLWQPARPRVQAQMEEKRKRGLTRGIV